MKIPAPPPGKYPGTPFDLYASWNATNHGRLCKVAKSPRHFQLAGDSDSPAKIVGRAAHVCLLEPDAFEAAVDEAPVNPATGSAYGYGTKKYLDAAAQARGKVLLSRDDIDLCVAMRNAVWGHAGAREILQSPAMGELSVVWNDQNAGGLTCKMRGDRVSEYHWVDFKTCESADKVSFSRSLVSFGYATSQAFYDRGRTASGMTGAKPTIIACEKEYPHEVAVFEIGENTMQAARQMVREWMDVVARCLETGVFPGYSQQIEVIEAPTYFFRGYADGE